MPNDIHIIAPFIFANDGDWQAIDLYLQYSKTHRVMLWSQQPVHAELKSKYSIQEIKPYSGQSPNSGTLIICGAQTNIGYWYDHAKFEKIILYHNIISQTVLYKSLHRLTMNGKRDVEIIYVSELVKSISGLAGEVRHYLPAIERFTPAKNTSPQQSRPFTVGRISADNLSKHHHSDIAVYKSLVDSGMNIRIIGGTCLAPWLNDYPNISLLPAVPQAQVTDAYNTLDCFYYRVTGTVKEAYGLAIIEAMLSGLPVVCHRNGGYAEVIQDGVNGFLFDSADEAIAIINHLKSNANLRKEIGICAQSLSF